MRYKNKRRGDRVSSQAPRLPSLSLISWKEKNCIFQCNGKLENYRKAKGGRGAGGCVCVEGGGGRGSRQGGDGGRRVVDIEEASGRGDAGRGGRGGEGRKGNSERNTAIPEVGNIK